MSKKRVYRVLTYGCLCEADKHDRCGEHRTLKVRGILSRHGYYVHKAKIEGYSNIITWRNKSNNKRVIETHIFGR